MKCDVFQVCRFTFANMNQLKGLTCVGPLRGWAGLSKKQKKRSCSPAGSTRADACRIIVTSIFTFKNSISMMIVVPYVLHNFISRNDASKQIYLSIALIINEFKICSNLLKSVDHTNIQHCTFVITINFSKSSRK